MKKKLLSVLLVLCMVLTLMPIAALADFSDTDGHWGKDSIDRWAEQGVLNGKGDGVFDPNGSMTRAEFAQMLCNLMGYTKKASNSFVDVPDDAWYADAILKLVEAGVLNGVGNNMAAPNAPITREQAAVMLCRAFNIKTGSGSLSYADAGDVSSWATGAVSALTEMGMLNGVGDNQVAPQMNINRASVAKLIDNMVVEYVTEDKVITGEVNGIVLVAADVNVTFENADVNAPIIVAPAAAGAEVTLTGTTSAGDVVVAAEKAAVTVDKDASAGTVTADAPKAEVKVDGKADAVEVTGENATATVAKDAEVGSVSVDAAGASAQIAGKVDSVDVNAGSVSTEKGSEVGTLTTTPETTAAKVDGKVENAVADGTKIETGSNAVIENVDIKGDGAGVTGSGKVENATVDESATNAAVDTKGTNVENNSTETVGGVKPGETGTTSGSSSTGGGGSSSGGTPSTPTGAYTITVASGITNGTVTTSVTSADAGAEVTITATPDDGYALDTITVTDAESGNVTVTDNKFTMPDKNVTVTATFKALPTLTVAAKSGTVYEKASTDIQDGIAVGTRTGKATTGYTIPVTGVSKYVSSNWTQFSSKEDEQTGNYVWLEFTLSADGLAGTKVDFKSSDVAAPDLKPLIPANGNKEDMVWCLNTHDTIEITITYDTGKTIAYTIDLTGVDKASAADKIVTFDSNGGSAVASAVAKDGKVNKPATDPTKDGYTFVEWCSGSADGSAFDFNSTIEEDTTLYAKWTATEYTITYNLDDGTNPSEAPAKYTIESAKITLPTPTKAGKGFAGWYESADFSGDAVTEIATESTGNKTFYAKWVELVIAAPLGENTGAGEKGDYADSYSVTVEGDTITIHATGLKRHEASGAASPKVGYHVGVGLFVDAAKVEAAEYAAGWGEAPTSPTCNTAPDSKVVVGTANYATFYFTYTNAFKTKGQNAFAESGGQGVVNDEVVGYIATSAKTYTVKFDVKLAAPTVDLVYEADATEAGNTYAELARTYGGYAKAEPPTKEDACDQSTVLIGMNNLDPTKEYSLSIVVKENGTDKDVKFKGKEDNTIWTKKGTASSIVYLTLDPTNVPYGSWLYTGTSVVGDTAQKNDENVFHLDSTANYVIEVTLKQGTTEVDTWTTTITGTPAQGGETD